MEKYALVFAALESIVVGIQVDLDCCEEHEDRAWLVREYHYLAEAIDALKSAQNSKKES
jgi:hypothetical protein